MVRTLAFDHLEGCRDLFCGTSRNVDDPVQSIKHFGKFKADAGGAAGDQEHAAALITGILFGKGRRGRENLVKGWSHVLEQATTCTAK